MRFLPSLEDYTDDGRNELPFRGDAQCYIGYVLAYGGITDAFFHGTEQEFLDQLHGGGVHVHNANWYSHRDVLIPPYERVEIADSTSSAGDWTLAVYDGEYWHFAWQENAYPYSGFTIGINLDEPSAETLDELYGYYEE